MIPGQRILPASAPTLGKVDKYSAKRVVPPPGTKLRRAGTTLAMMNSQGARDVPKRDSFSRISICDVKQWSTRADGRRWRQDGCRAGLRGAGADGPVGAMVADCQPAIVPAELDFCHTSDRNRRAGSANAQLAPRNGCRCADRLRSEPTPDRARWRSDPASHLKPRHQRALYPSSGRETISAAAVPSATAANCFRAPVLGMQPVAT